MPALEFPARWVDHVAERYKVRVRYAGARRTAQRRVRDVGQGAQDDGAGCVLAMETLRLMKRLGLRPRRTVRCGQWVNEENGGRAYADSLRGDVSRHVAAIESDGGAERPIGFQLGIHVPGSDSTDVSRTAVGLERLRAIAPLFAGLGADRMTDGGGEADIGPMMDLGVPGISHRTMGEHYFDWHHTRADMLDQVDPVELRRNVAALAALVYLVADMPEPLAGPSPARRDTSITRPARNGPRSTTVTTTFWWFARLVTRTRVPNSSPARNRRGAHVRIPHDIGSARRGDGPHSWPSPVFTRRRDNELGIRAAGVLATVATRGGEPEHDRGQVAGGRLGALLLVVAEHDDRRAVVVVHQVAGEAAGATAVVALMSAQHGDHLPPEPIVARPRSGHATHRRVGHQATTRERPIEGEQVASRRQQATPA